MINLSFWDILTVASISLVVAVAVVKAFKIFGQIKTRLDENASISLISESIEKAKSFDLVKDLGVVWAMAREAKIWDKDDVDYSDPRLISLILSEEGFGLDFVSAARLGRVYREVGKLDGFLIATNGFLFNDATQIIENSLRLSVMHAQITGEIKIQGGQNKKTLFAQKAKGLKSVAANSQAA